MRKNHSKIVCIKLVHLPYVLMLNLLVTGNKTCEISGSHCSDVKDSSLLGCDAVSFSESFPTLWKDCCAFTCRCLAVQDKFFSCHV